MSKARGWARHAAMLLLCAGCTAPAAAKGGDGRVIVSVVGTSDLHGHIEKLPLLAGYMANLRVARARDRGAVLLVDAGDMWQGTLESNLGEGSAVVEAYELLQYDAVAIGNHEFDFGPVGPAATARTPGADPRGALKARAAQGRFPFLAANLRDTATGLIPPKWPNVHRSVLVERAGIKVGLIGLTTTATPHTTIAANFAGVEVTSLVDAAVNEAKELRRMGAQVVVVLAHAGGGCGRLDQPHDLGSCEVDTEIMKFAQALPRGLVDAIVAGHTHQGMAHIVNGIPVIESFHAGRAFGRIDLEVDRHSGSVELARVFPPRTVEPGSYEGQAAIADEVVIRALADDVERARGLREQRLGVRLEGPIRRSYEEESALGNMLADLMLEARNVQVAVTNGGGLRADLGSGELTYGQLYQAFPFDNRFAVLRLRGRQLQDVVARNLQGKGGILSVAGFRVRANCLGATLDVELVYPDGKAIGDEEVLTLTTNEFLATGGDSVFASLSEVTLDEGAPIRDEVAALLRQKGGSLRSEAFHDPRQPRLLYPGPRPVRCQVPAKTP